MADVSHLLTEGTIICLHYEQHNVQYTISAIGVLECDFISCLALMVVYKLQHLGMNKSCWVCYKVLPHECSNCVRMLKDKIQTTSLYHW